MEKCKYKWDRLSGRYMQIVLIMLIVVVVIIEISVIMVIIDNRNKIRDKNNMKNKDKK